MTQIVTPPAPAQAERHPLDEIISFGPRIKRPDVLQPRTVGEVLLGIREGEWTDAIQVTRIFDEMARACGEKYPEAAEEAHRLKTGLPYVTWGGEFLRRDASHLRKRSGLVGIDIDALDDSAQYCVLDAAQDDPHCLTAYRSCRGSGIRIVLRVPKGVPHEACYVEARDHVRRRYRVEPDEGGDICRASFVSFDSSAIINPDPVILPVAAPAASFPSTPQTPLSDTLINVSDAGLREVHWSLWLARAHLPWLSKPDGTAFTHVALLGLAKAVAVRAGKQGETVREDWASAIAAEWYASATERWRLRRTLDEYTAELWIMLSRATRNPKVRTSIDAWLKWTREPDCPTGPPIERLLYAIRRYCAGQRSPKFFISVRDAGNVAGVSHDTGGNLLRKLVHEGRLAEDKRANLGRPARHAISYVLIEHSDFFGNDAEGNTKSENQI